MKQKPGEAATHVPKPDLMAYVDQVSEGPVQEAHLNVGARRSGHRGKKQGLVRVFSFWRRVWGFGVCRVFSV